MLHRGDTVNSAGEQRIGSILPSEEHSEQLYRASLSKVSPAEASAMKVRRYFPAALREIPAASWSCVTVMPGRHTARAFASTESVAAGVRTAEVRTPFRGRVEAFAGSTRRSAYCRCGRTVSPEAGGGKIE